MPAECARCRAAVPPDRLDCPACHVLVHAELLKSLSAAADEHARRWVLVEIRDRNDNRIELTYDEEGRLVEALDSAGRTIGIDRTRSGHIGGLHVRDAARDRWIHVSRYTYDDAGDLAAAFDAEGHATRFHYDEEHRLTRKTDREGLAFCFVYDRQGRCVEAWGEYPGQADPSLAEDVPAKLADGAKARGVRTDWATSVRRCCPAAARLRVLPLPTRFSPNIRC